MEGSKSPEACKHYPLCEYLKVLFEFSGSFSAKVDRRKRIRYKVVFPVMMKTPQGSMVGVMKNMNGKDAFIRYREPLIPRGTFVLQVELPKGSSAELSAELIWTRFFESNEELGARGMGVRFLWGERDSERDKGPG